MGNGSGEVLLGIFKLCQGLARAPNVVRAAFSCLNVCGQFEGATMLITLLITFLSLFLFSISSAWRRSVAAERRSPAPP